MSVARNAAVINEQIRMNMTLRDDANGKFDPDAIQKVEIYDSDTDALLETVTSTTKLSFGKYQIVSALSWNTIKRDTYDVWFFTRKLSGAQKTVTGNTTINEPQVSPVVPGIPTAVQIRTHLEGYGITASIISDDWIEEDRDYNIIPKLQKRVNFDFASEETLSRYFSGTGEPILMLDSKNITSIESIRFVSSDDIDGNINLSAIEFISDLGILKAKGNISEGQYFRLFPKGKDNIKVTFKSGGSIPGDLALALKKWACCNILTEIESRTGGGSINTQGWSRDFGSMGKYTNIRLNWNRQIQATIRSYSSSVVGS